MIALRLSLLLSLTATPALAQVDAPPDTALQRTLTTELTAALRADADTGRIPSALSARLAVAEVRWGSVDLARLAALGEPRLTVDVISAVVRTQLAAKDFDGALVSAALASDTGTRYSLIREVVRQLDQQGDTRRALSIAAGLPPLARLQSLVNIAGRMGSTAPEQAVALLRDLRKALPQSIPNYPLRMLLAAQAALGDDSAAFAALRGPLSPEDRELIARALAAALRGRPAGDSATAIGRAIAAEIADRATRENHLDYLDAVQQRGGSGMRRGERAIARLAEDTGSAPAWVLIQRIRDVAGIHNLPSLLSAIRRLRLIDSSRAGLDEYLYAVDLQTDRWPTPLNRQPPLPADTVALLVAEGLAASRSIPNPASRDSIRTRLAIAQARIDRSGAMATARPLRDRSMTDEVRVAAAVAAIGSLRIDEAEHLLAYIRGEASRDTIRLAIARRFIRGGDSEAAVQMLSRMRSDSMRSQGLMSLGRAELNAGRMDEGVATLVHALHGLDPLLVHRVPAFFEPKYFGEDFFVGDSATTPLVRMNQIAPVLDWARQQPTPRRRAVALLFVINSLERAGRWGDGNPY